MKRTSMIATLVAAAFALPLAATAGGVDKTTGAKTTSTMSDTKMTASEAFTSADKNGDGFVSMEEAKGTPHAALFTSLDRNGDGKLSNEEHATAKDYVAVQPGAMSGNVTTSPAATPSTDTAQKTN